MKDLDDIPALMADIGARARPPRRLATAPAEAKRAALRRPPTRSGPAGRILAANAKDLALGRDKGLSDAMMDRLRLTRTGSRPWPTGCARWPRRTIPVGEVMAEWDMPSGLHIRRVRTPLGVVGVIYESRPNVTADAGALCLKSGNAVILRGGSESFHSSKAIHACLVEGLRAAGLPEDAIQLVPTRDRAAVGDADHDRHHRRDRAARGQGPCRAGAARGARAGLCPSRRDRAYLCRRGGRSGQGAERGPQCQDAPHRHLRGGRMPADPPRRGGHDRAGT